MRFVMFATTVTLLTAAPLLAQTERGYLAGTGGFAVAPGATSASTLGEVGVRIAPHLSLFGNVGRYRNLQPTDAQSAVDTTTSIAAAQGLDVVGSARVPAWYSTGGVRYEMPGNRHVTPYLSGGLGFARLSPSAQFTFTSGTFPDGSTPPLGFDVTPQLTTAGDFTELPASTAALMMLGGGVEIPVAHRWAIDAGYRFSRVATDTPLNTQGAAFGVGYRF